MGYFLYDSAIKKTKKCVICGKQFVTTHPNKKTCSIECSSIQRQKTFKAANKDIARYNRKSK